MSRIYKAFENNNTKEIFKIANIAVEFEHE